MKQKTVKLDGVVVTMSAKALENKISDGCRHIIEDGIYTRVVLSQQDVEDIQNGE